MQNYKKQFKGKKITVMGLGLLGRGIGYTKFLAECGADLIVTDLKTKEQLAPALKALEKYSKPAPKQGLGAEIVLEFPGGKLYLSKNEQALNQSEGLVGRTDEKSVLGHVILRGPATFVYKGEII
jgi:UDP-N-acetylmuramoylalanine-D-glutamate ligase